MKSAFSVLLLCFVLASCGEEKGLGTTKKTEATLDSNKLVMACSAFFEEYQVLPMASTSAIDAEQVTDNNFMAPLLGLDSGKDDNPKLFCFFDYLKTAREINNSAVDRLVRTETTASLVDPWGNFYRVLCDYDGDYTIREPQATGRSGLIQGRRVLVYSLGPDGIAGGEGEKDNIYSWSVSRE